MYGKQKNSYGNLVSEFKAQLISAQSILYISKIQLVVYYQYCVLIGCQLLVGYLL